MKQKAVICDLDGTLADASHRVHLAKAKKWKQFFALAPQDPLHAWVLEIIKAMEQSGYKILFVTGRPDSCLQDTKEWLEKFTHFKITEGENLFMRPGNDRRPDTTIKEEIFHKHLANKYDILFAIDDKSHIYRLWKKLKIPTLFCGDEWE